MEPAFFATPAELRAWLEINHEAAPEILVGFHRKGTGQPSMTWPESVDQALCFGWIDGVVRRIDETRYSRRFTPRRPRSIRSNVNIRRFRELAEVGLAVPAGQRALDARSDERFGVCGHERDKTPSSSRRRTRGCAGTGPRGRSSLRSPPGTAGLRSTGSTNAKRPEKRAVPEGVELRVADVRRNAAGAGDSHISNVLARLRDQGLIVARGTGRGARWERLPSSSDAGTG